MANGSDYVGAWQVNRSDPSDAFAGLMIVGNLGSSNGDSLYTIIWQSRDQEVNVVPAVAGSGLTLGGGPPNVPIFFGGSSNPGTVSVTFDAASGTLSGTIQGNAITGNGGTFAATAAPPPN
jgi:hypothetical protein